MVKDIRKGQLVHIICKHQMEFHCKHPLLKDIKAGKIVDFSLKFSNSHLLYEKETGILFEKPDETNALLILIAKIQGVPELIFKFFPRVVATAIIPFDELCKSAELKAFLDFGKDPKNLTHQIHEVRIFSKWVQKHF